MKKYLVLSLAVVLIFGLGSVAWAASSDTQTVTITVDEIAAIDVTADTLTLTISTVTTAGAPPDDATDSSAYALYTSVVETGTRTIDAAITTGTILAGLQLKLVATPPENCGSAVTGGVTFDADNTAGGSIITGIGSCATGTTDGAQLTYTLSVTDFASLVVGTTDVTVTFTLTDAAA